MITNHCIGSARRLCFILLLIAQAHVALAQTTADPNILEFDPSSDHATLAADGTSVVREYVLSVYLTGQTTAFKTVTLGKPAPDAGGKIRLDVLPLLSPFTIPGVVYEARVTASGSRGVALSPLSNRFQYTAVAPCSYATSATGAPLIAAGGSGSVTVTTAAGCQWTASSSASWLAVTAGASGSGAGSVGFSATPNSVTTARTATLTIAGTTVTVSQAASASCSYATETAALPVTAKVAVTGGSLYTWAPATSDPRGLQRAATGRVMAAWYGASLAVDVDLVDGQSHQVAIYVADYDDSARQQTVEVQDVNGAVLDSRTVGTFAPGQYLVWTMRGHLTIRIAGVSGPNALLSGVLIGPDPGAAAGAGTTRATFVTTDLSTHGDWKGVYGADAYTVAGDTASQLVTAAGGPATITVTTAAGCGWTATSGAAWLALTSGASGTGPGTVAVTVAANAGIAARTATMTIGGQVITVTQAGGGCTSTISAASAALAAAGGSGSVTVTTATGCAWTASSSAPWLTVTSGVSGSGTGAVAFAAPTNSLTTPRAAELTIAGKAFAVTQGGTDRCSVAFSTAEDSVGDKAATGSVTVTTGTGCAWTSTSSAPWLTVPPGATGSGLLTYRVTANTGGVARTATIVVRGVTFTLIQRADATPSPPGRLRVIGDSVK